MGPAALFDKSFLQSLSTDESVWFDHYFLAVVCPIFHVETLADLAKEASRGRSAEDVVKDIAMKFPEMGGSPCIFHHELCLQNLLGHEVPLTGQIPRAGGRPVKSGTLFDPTPEEEAFKRWQRGNFAEIEKIAASDWRKAVADIDLVTFAKELRNLGLDGKTCKSLEQARDLARGVVRGKDKGPTRLGLAVNAFQVPQQFHAQIFNRWDGTGRLALEVFAPYAAFVLEIEMFFQFALAANLIATERPSNRMDIAYLFYLPFCHVFISTDNLHRRCAPLFLRPDQKFVWGVDLKAGLRAANTEFLQLPEEEREKGVIGFGRNPPKGNALSEIWEAFEGDEPDPGRRPPRDPEKDAEIVRRMKAFSEEKTLEPHEASQSADDMISVARSIKRRRGSWYQVPKDMKDD